MSRPMTYRLATDTRQSAWKQGTVLDMSATGIRFEAAIAISEGTQIDMVIDWPGIYHGREGVRLFLTGTVCRSGSDGIAMRLTNHDFRFVPVEIPARFRQKERKLAVA